jgi:hypothetical protein
MTQQNDVAKKKAYTRPEITRYPLRPEEAVLGFCKSSTTSGSNGATCSQFGNCSVPGS